MASLPKISFFRQDTLNGTLNLRLNDASTGTTLNYPIEMGSIVEVLFPAEEGTPVVLTTTDSEVVIVDAAASTIQFNGDAAKSALMKLGPKQSLDVVVKQGISGKVQTFQYTGLVTIMDRANPGG